MRKLTLSFIALCFSFTLYSQREYGSFHTMVFTSKLSEKTAFFTQLRFHDYEVWNNKKMFLIRYGLDVKLASKFKLHLGLANVSIEPEEKSTIDAFQKQHWIYEELHFNTGNSNQLKFSARLRHENRWIKFNGDAQATQKERNRLQLRLTRDLTKQVYLTSFDELFFTKSLSYFEKHRFFIGAGVKPNKNFKFELGYLTEGKDRFWNPYLVTRINYSTSWMKK